jgi:hypothetical protein
VKLAGRVSGGLIKTLAVYRDYSRHLQGDTIDPWSLVVQTIERFVRSDREVQASRQRSNEAPDVDAQVTTGARTESRNGEVLARAILAAR